MKKFLLFVASVCFATVSFGQRPTATIQQVNDMVQNATLYVVFEESPMSDYNGEIRKAVEKNWTLTSVKFVHLSDLDSTKLQNPNNAFLTPVSMQFAEDKDSVRYTFLSLLIGGQYETINDLPEVCTFPLGYELVDEMNFTYKLSAIVAFFNKHVQNIQSNPKLLKDKKYATYTKQKKSIAGKTIYVAGYEQNASLASTDAIKSVCQQANVVVTDDTSMMEKVIRRKEANAMFLHVVGINGEWDLINDGELVAGRCYKVLMDVEGNLYYFAFHKMAGNANSTGMTAKDWKTLNSFTK